MNSQYQNPAKTLPKFFGIVNITSDSFSDGSLFIEPTAALKHARQLKREGALVLDIGASSSHPDSQTVSAKEEIYRLNPVIDVLIRENYKISIDSYKTEVQRYAIKKGVHYLNDTSGFPNSSFYNELADASCHLIIMYSIQKSGIASRQKTDPRIIYKNIFHFFEERINNLIQHGIDTKRLIIDPGMGFFLGENPTSSLYVLKKLNDIRRHFCIPIMISVSRKSFLGDITNRSVNERAAATLSAELFAWQNNADYIRTHEVSQIVDACKVWLSLKEI